MQYILDSTLYVGDIQLPTYGYIWLHINIFQHSEEPVVVQCNRTSFVLSQHLSVYMKNQSHIS